MSVSYQKIFDIMNELAYWEQKRDDAYQRESQAITDKGLASREISLRKRELKAYGIDINGIKEEGTE